MIAFIKGILADSGEESAVIECGGIGYEIMMPGSNLGRLPAIGEPVKIYKYTYVREDAIGLFGFLEKQDLEAFKMVITVSGIGPKAGMGILSVLPSDQLYMAILSEDVKAITGAPGVGPKTAKRLIMELKDKIDLLGMVNPDPKVAVKSVEDDDVKEAILALTALGYSQSEAVNAIRKIGDTAGLSSGDLLRQALRNML